MLGRHTCLDQGLSEEFPLEAQNIKDRGTEKEIGENGVTNLNQNQGGGRKVKRESNQHGGLKRGVW